MFQKNSALQKQASVGTLIYREKEEEKLFTPFSSSRYFSQPQDFPGCISFPRTRHWQLDTRLLRDCFKEWRCRGLSVSNLIFVSPSAHEIAAAPGSNFWTILILKDSVKKGSAVIFCFYWVFREKPHCCSLKKEFLVVSKICESLYDLSTVPSPELTGLSPGKGHHKSYTFLSAFVQAGWNSVLSWITQLIPCFVAGGCSLGAGHQEVKWHSEHYHSYICPAFGCEILFRLLPGFTLTSSWNFLFCHSSPSSSWYCKETDKNS